ncbi:MAG: hypothetical protein ATN35_06375 [Epulopiscium sp. Nele67-Bin004]|nr:MAG: hypothetical protein ATN35_06375 [Epulopiscium sp. Nele67-Bin004]
MNKKIVLQLMSAMFVGTLATQVYGSNTGEIAIVFTNDIHCGIENNMGYAGLAAYRDEMKEIYGDDNVVLVDSGDAVQGGAIGGLTKGQYIIDIMNEVNYDIFLPGNHEFDYEMPRFFELMDMLDAEIIACNLIDLSTGDQIYSPYALTHHGETTVAYIGIITPETFTKSTPAYFQDENGEFIYSLSEDTTGQRLFDIVQQSIDDAIADGADYVIGLGHLGIEETAAPWRSTDVIENTTGFDVLIDGHSHSLVQGEIVKDKDGNDVIVTQAGTKFDAIGLVVINPETDTITTDLIYEYDGRDAKVQAFIDGINEEFDGLLNTVVAQSEVMLSVNDPISGERIIRNNETNLGNLSADAYRTLLDTDIALINAGGIRADVPAGDITNNQIIDVHPFGNDATSVLVTGQVVLDALEMGARNYPSENGGFLQPSGLTYDIDVNVPSSVMTDDQGSFVSVDGEYRVKNVMVGGEPLDLNKEYSVGSHNYMLLSYGDGMSMFRGSTLLKDKFMVDNEVLIHYITNNLGGVVGEEYSNTYGQGRIGIIGLDEEVVEITTESVVETVVQDTTPAVVETVVQETAPAVVETVVQETTPVVVETVSTTTYTVASGDTLKKIALNLLGSEDRYTEIYELNTGILNSPNLIYVGQVLTVPTK